MQSNIYCTWLMYLNHLWKSNKWLWYHKKYLIFRLYHPTRSFVTYFVVWIKYWVFFISNLTVASISDQWFFSAHIPNCANTCSTVWNQLEYHKNSETNHRHTSHITQLHMYRYYTQTPLSVCVHRAGCGWVRMHWGEDEGGKRTEVLWLVLLTQLFFTLYRGKFHR